MGRKRDDGTSPTSNLAWDATDSLAEITPHQKYLLRNCSLFLIKNTFYRFAAKEFWQMVLDLRAYQETEIHKKEDFQPNFPVI